MTTFADPKKSLPKKKKRKEMTMKPFDKENKDDLLTFKEAIRNLAELKSNFMFNNSNPDHAALVLTTMLEYSHKEFVIYDDNLSGDLANRENDFYYQLEGFVERNGRLKIVVDEVKDKESRIYQALVEMHKEHPERVSLRLASKDFQASVHELLIHGVKHKDLNFACGDSTSFRLEADRGERKALCSFNRPDVASVLVSTFDKKFNTCYVLL